VNRTRPFLSLYRFVVDTVFFTLSAFLNVEVCKDPTAGELDHTTVRLGLLEPYFIIQKVCL
jgi:hypothetical protein